MRFGLCLAIGLVSSISLPALSSAQSTDHATALNGPVQAYTFDVPTRSIRAVFGVPGSASFGPALMENLEFGAIAPGQNYGLVFEGGKCLLVSDLGANKVATSPISGVTAYPDGIAWAANGSLAVLYSRAGDWFQIVSGLPGSPVAAALVKLSSLGGSLTAVAADAAGKQVAVGVSGDKGGVYEAANGWVAPLASMANPISLSFSIDGNTLYMLDAASSQVTAVALGNHSLQTFGLDGISNPVAIRALQDSANHSVLYVAAGKDRLLRMIDLSSGQTNDLALSFQPTNLDNFNGHSFVLAARAQSVKPLWLFSSTTPSIAYFVPAVHSREPIHRGLAAAGRSR